MGLSAGERRYRSIVQSALDGIITIDHCSRITEFNPAAEVIFGYCRDEVIGRDLGETIIPPEMRQAHREGVQRHLHSRQAPRLGMRLQLMALKADGTLFPIELTVTRVEDGEQAQFTAFIRDLTRQRRVEEQASRLGAELESSERVLATLLANLPGMAYRCRIEPGWPFDFASEGALALCGYTPGDLVGRAVTWQGLVHPEDRPLVAQGVQQASERGGRFQLTYRIHTASGEEKWVREQGTAITDVAGRALGIEGLVIDITAERHAQQEIDRMNRELEVRVRQRTRDLEMANSELEAFSYSIAHDLRSPLTSIDGFTRALLESHAERLDASGTHYLNRVRGAVRHMSELTDAMLSLASVTRARPKSEPVDLAAAARAVLAQLAESDPERKTVLELPEVMWVLGDRLLLHQVMANLIGNAWKFSAHAPVTYIRLASERDEHGQTVYVVQDRGAGFDMVHSQRLFGAFERLHAQSEFTGTGIGLAIVQKIVSRHGGQIWARARPQQGASFFFTLGTTPGTVRSASLPAG